jgi:hypothetical protein
VAIAREGFEMLASQKEDAAAYSDTLDALIEGGIRYVHFAIANPERYKLMFGTKIESRCNFDGLMEAGQTSFGLIIKRVEHGIAEGLLIDQDPLILARSCWTTVHGISSLFIDGYFHDLGYNLEDFLRKEVTLCIRGMLKDTSLLDSKLG